MNCEEKVDKEEKLARQVSSQLADSPREIPAPEKGRFVLQEVRLVRKYHEHVWLAGKFLPVHRSADYRIVRSDA
jgi:predicted deacylase